MANILSHFKRKYHFYSLSVLSGFLVGTSYIPYPAWAILFCYIPLWFALAVSEKENLSLKSQFIYAWITQFILTLIGFNWIYYTAYEFGHLPKPVAFVTLLLFAGLMHLYIPISLVFASFLKRRFNLSITRHIFLMALLLSVFERFWPSIFQWNLGYTLLWMKWPVFQLADVIGFSGLSSIIFLIQAFLLVGLMNYKENKKIFFAILISLISGLITANYIGLTKELKWSQADQKINFAITQGNVGNEEKLISELGRGFQNAIVQKYTDQVDNFLMAEKQKALTTLPDIILWPETALPLALDNHLLQKPLQNLVLARVKTWNTVLITGAYSHDQIKKDFLGETLMRNAVFFLAPDGLAQSPYYKSQLLAFGEYLPFGEVFPFLYKLMPFVGTYEKGPGPVTKNITLINQKTVRLGPQICYESLDPEFSRGLAKSGTEIIFNVTNDSWFGDWAEPYQHLYMTLARAVEVRRPLVRGTNTGISSVILANGNVLEQSKMNQRWMQNYNISYQQNPSLTFYTEYGHFDWVFLMLAILFLLFKKTNIRRQNDKR